MAQQHQQQQKQVIFPVLFSAFADGVQLACSMQHVEGTEAQGLQTLYKLLVVDAAHLRGWSAQFSVQAMNTALQDEELSAAELDEVLARVLSCQQALTAVLQQPGNQLRLEAWCHRTQRVPLLPPTQQQRRHPDSNYRQAAFCVSLPVSLSLAQPQWMKEQSGQAFADINAGLVAAFLQRDQQQQDHIHILRSQLQLLYSHTAQLQLLSDRAVRTAVRGTAGLKDDPSKHQQQQQQQNNNNAKAGGAAAAAAGGSRLGLTQSFTQHQALLFEASQFPTGTGTTGAAFALPSSQSTLLGGGAAAAAGGGGGGSGSGGSIPVQRAGSGGGGRPLGGAAAGGGRAHLARQTQDEKALKQMWGEQQALARDWQQQLLQLLEYEGPLEPFLEQLAEQKGRAGEAAVAAAAAAGRRVQAYPWHLGRLQQQQQEQRQQEDLQEEDDDDEQQVGGPPSFFYMQPVEPAADEQPSSSQLTQPPAAAETGLVAAVAPAKQKHTGTGHLKRKLAEGKAAVLKRGRR